MQFLKPSESHQKNFKPSNSMFKPAFEAKDKNPTTFLIVYKILCCCAQFEICGKLWNVILWCLSQISKTLLSANNDWKHHSTFLRRRSHWKSSENKNNFRFSFFLDKFGDLHFLVSKRCLMCQNIFGRRANPKESCKVQFEGNSEPISRIYKGIAALSHSAAS